MVPSATHWVSTTGLCEIKVSLLPLVVVVVVVVVSNGGFGSRFVLGGLWYFNFELLV